MAKKNRRMLPVYFSPAQYKVLQQMAGSQGMSSLLRDLARAEAERRRLKWPDDLIERGTYKRNPEGD